MPGVVTRIEQSVTLRADPERVFAALVDPNYIPHYTAGIEAAEVVAPGPDGGLVGTSLQLGTTSGRVLAATVKDHQPGRLLEIEDENGLISTWTVEPRGDGQVFLKNTLVGSLPLEKANKLRYDADVKFQAMMKIFEDEAAPEDPAHATSGATRITGTSRTPR